MATPLQLELDYLLSLPIVTYFDVVALALYIWDYLITFDMEIDLVWNSKWNFMKCLYLVQRHLPLVDVVILISYQTFGKNMSAHLCNRVYDALAVMMVSGIILSESLLALRIWAVWGRGKWPTVVLGLSLVIFLATSYVFIGLFLKSFKFENPPYPGYRGCISIAANKFSLFCFITLMVWDIWTLMCILIPGIRAYQAGGRSAMFVVVYRDGVIYYLYLVVLSVLNVIAIAVFPLGQQYIFLSMQRCFHTVLASRVLLHIRQQVKNDTEIPSFVNFYGIDNQLQSIPPQPDFSILHAK